MTKTQIAVRALLAGTVVSIGAYTLSITGVQAQDRGSVVTAARTLQSVKHTDGGVGRRAVLDEVCAAAILAADDGLAEHMRTGIPGKDQVVALLDARDSACQAIQALRDKIETARLAHEVMQGAYLCRHLERGCPDGGTP